MQLGLTEHFFERNLYELLRSGREIELNALCRALRVTEDERTCLDTLAANVRLGMDKARFWHEVELLRSARFDAEFLRFNGAQLRDNRSLEETLHTLTAAKSVALVGPAASRVAQGAEIDAHEIVVRLNFQFPPPIELRSFVGARTDVLFHCCNGDFPVERMFESAAQFPALICYQQNREARTLRRLARARNIPVTDVSRSYQELSQLLGTSVSTGTVALALLCAAPLRQLSLFGLTAFCTPYQSGYLGHGNVAEHWRDGIPSAVGPHRIAPHIKFWKETLAADSRIIPDELLQSALASATL